MNENNVIDPIQPQESSVKETVSTQSSENTSNGIGQKGNTLIIVGLVFLMAIIGAGAYFLGTQKAGKEVNLPTKVTTSSTPSPTLVEQSKPSPNQTGGIVKLSDAWNLGTKTYSSPNINITFDYPSYFELRETDVVAENAKWATQYKNDPNVRQPLYKSSFFVTLSTPELEPKTSSSDEIKYEQEISDICDNKMRVSVQMYNNSQNLTLYNFIADLQKSYPGDGITETFDTYKKGLKSTTLPKADSYVFEGVVGENPVKTVYFTNKEKVYTFGLIGNCNTGGQYTPDADKVLQSILKSIKYL